MAGVLIAATGQVLAVLGHHAPEGLDVDAVAGELAAIGGVRNVHDLHLWTLTSGMHPHSSGRESSTPPPAGRLDP
ncbi:hypothetical protein AB0K34_18095 [Actinomadura sp. NPDC049382]|uniref:hypothetical protein n=1 Tax=Actinomadura sp. NPDC049382 TaxID=3158220 RepID=UPI00342677A7